MGGFGAGGVAAEERFEETVGVFGEVGGGVGNGDGYAVVVFREVDGDRGAEGGVGGGVVDEVAEDEAGEGWVGEGGEVALLRGDRDGEASGFEGGCEFGEGFAKHFPEGEGDGFRRGVAVVDAGEGGEALDELVELVGGFRARFQMADVFLRFARAGEGELGDSTEAGDGGAEFVGCVADEVLFPIADGGEA